MDVLAGLLAGTEAVMGEPNTGITSGLTGLWSALDELTLDPPNASARRHVISSLNQLTTTISGVAEKWDIEAKSASNSLSAYVEETNTLLREVAALNLNILNASALPGTPNDLLDQRDILLDELANIAGVTVATTENGAARVSLEGLALVADGAVSLLSYDSATHDIMHASGTTVTPGGELAGFQSYLQTELPASKQRSTPSPANSPMPSTPSTLLVSLPRAIPVATFSPTSQAERRCRLQLLSATIPRSPPQVALPSQSSMDSMSKRSPPSARLSAPQVAL